MINKSMKHIDSLLGLHHVTAITSDAKRIYDFYTKILGMRLVKKNVNQDDIKTYHLFFADDRGNPGTEMTFFDFKGIDKHQIGTNDISRTSFRVSSDEALAYWEKRFAHYSVKHSQIEKLFDTNVIFFEDFDGQRYALFSDENNRGVAAGEPWHKGPVPDEYAIIGLGPIFLTVDSSSFMNQVLEDILQFKKTGEDNNYYRYEMGEGGNGASVIVDVNTTSRSSMQGYGGVHHVAFRTKTKQHLMEWLDYFNQRGLRNSGFVERFYFQSVYIRLHSGILFELATDEPGFIDDEETYEMLGQTLTLPPHLRQHRNYVESVLKPFDSTWPTAVEKEYL